MEEDDWPGKEERRDTTQKAQLSRDVAEALENGASRSCDQLSVSEVGATEERGTSCVMKRGQLL